MLVDANVLLFAVDDESAFHARAAAWLESVLNGRTRVGFPWPSLVAFLRISTHARALDRPLKPTEAWRYVGEWLDAAPAWVPLPTERHAEVLRELVTSYDLRGKLVPDADLVALAIEHGLPICSADTDFARFREIVWINPVAGLT